MRKFLYLLCFGLLTTCDDGDVFEVTLDFGDEFKQCGELVFYKINESTSETLSIQFEDLTIEDILEVNDEFLYENTLPLGSGNVFRYRSYGTTPNNSFFCNDVPINLQIEKDEASLGGEVFIQTVLVEDDNDGIPTEIEDENLDGDNDPDTNPTDTDGDSIPDYLDADDDGDNVLTINEGHNYTEEDGFSNAQDSDDDGTYDYLDDDDDNDGVDTRDEDSDQDLNPANDRTIDTILNPNSIPDYLNDQIANPTIATAFRQHIIRLTYTISVTVSNITLPSITRQTLDFGTLNDSSNPDGNITIDSREASPNFN
ncbi:hypothetical protein [Psychroserpens sp. S379A]|uniref:hypothetical protein n=1 Tax=Psychroserpens sp. S379A TaxID=3415137 RepID=UPI003C7B4073